MFLNHDKVFTSLLCCKSDSSSLYQSQNHLILQVLPCARNTDSRFRSSARRYSNTWCQVTITLVKIAAAAREGSIFYDTRAFRKLISCTDPFSIIYFLVFLFIVLGDHIFSFYPVPCPFRELNWEIGHKAAILPS